MENEVGLQRREYCPVRFSVQLYQGPVYFCLRLRDTNNTGFAEMEPYEDEEETQKQVMGDILGDDLSDGGE